MQLSVNPGKYIIAVSGGVDSMLLLRLLAARPDLELVVAHFEHGIREDSDEDRLCVGRAADELDLPYIYDHGNLGAGASEATARAARYAFLEKVREEQGATAIITAHHQDDLLETAIINILRGTGRKGLTALADNPHIVRPLLAVPKQEILSYARKQGIAWREDSTNADQTYLRNRVRHTILPRFSDGQRQELLAIIAVMQAGNASIDTALTGMLALHEHEGAIDKDWFNALPPVVAAELIAAWLRKHGVRDFNRQTIMRLTRSARDALPGKQIDAQSGYRLHISRHQLRLLRTS